MAESVVAQLRAIPLFARLSEDDLEAVAALVKRAEYPAGTEVSQQGRIGITAYLVESGELRVLCVDPTGVESEVGRLGPGSFFGQTSLLVGEVRDATVEVVQDAVLLYLNKEDFDQLVHERPSLLRSLRVRPEIARHRKARRFKWQDADEVVVLRLHKHNVLLIQNLTFPTVVLLVGLACFYWYLSYGSIVTLVLGVPLTLASLLFSLYLYVNQRNDDYIVTNKRVVAIERVPLIRESRAEAPLRTIQDIQQSQEGPLARALDFGTLVIETAGERGHVVFRQIPHPTRTREIIFEQIQRMQSGARAEERAAIRDAMRRHFGIATPGAPAAAPALARRERRLKLALPGWLTAPLRAIRYFLPPLRYEAGDTITWRKHWVALIGTTTLPTTLIIVATGIAILLAVRSPTHPIPILIGYGTLMIFLFPWWLYKFEDWQNDIYQVTSTRIIDVNRLPFYLRETRREASLGRIQNITLEIPSILGKLLNYGSVTIEMAGGGGSFVFPYMKNPRAVQAEIFRRVEAFQRQQQKEEAERRRTELLDWFSVYDNLRRSQPAVTEPAPSPQQES
jgi:membrane protein YdbS with pleckstrin-like domain